TTESGWNSAHRVSPEPVPACAGRQMVFGVGGLQPCRDYYFAIKLGDESGNWSTLSINNPMGSTLCSDCCTVGERASLPQQEGSSAGAAKDGQPGAAGAQVTALPTAAAASGGGAAAFGEASSGPRSLDLKPSGLGGQS